MVPAPVPTPKPDPVPDWLEDFLGTPIGHPSERPPATAQGTAAMLGKLEQKLRVIGDRLGQGGGGAGGIGDLTDAIQLLLSFWQTPYPAGQYTLENPCKPQEEPLTAKWPGGAGEVSELNAKLDALAELVQHHKTMGQPVCIKERQGQPVTVILRERT